MGKCELGLAAPSSSLILLRGSARHASVCGGRPDQCEYAVEKLATAPRGATAGSEQAGGKEFARWTN